VKKEENEAFGNFVVYRVARLLSYNDFLGKIRLKTRQAENPLYSEN